jgi:hypothetical protein
MYACGLVSATEWDCEARRVVRRDGCTRRTNWDISAGSRCRWPSPPGAGPLVLLARAAAVVRSAASSDGPVVRTIKVPSPRKAAHVS